MFVVSCILGIWYSEIIRPFFVHFATSDGVFIFVRLLRRAAVLCWKTHPAPGQPAGAVVRKSGALQKYGFTLQTLKIPKLVLSFI